MPQDQLRRAREYRLFSRTLMPFYALLIAGHVVGYPLYQATGRLGLLWGPWGELRRAFTDTHRVPTVPHGGWMDLAAVLLCGAFFAAELKRQQTRSSGNERVLLAGFFVATLGAVAPFLPRDMAEGVYCTAAVLAAGMLTLARWRGWTSRVRLTAVGAATASAVVTAVLLRLSDMALLGQMGR